MSKQTDTSLLIVSSLPRFYQALLSGITDYKDLGSRIVKEIKLAHAFRQTGNVAELSQILVNNPIKEYQLIGQYYLAWSKYRGAENQPRIIERVIEQSKTYKSKALTFRGALSYYQGRFDEAMFFYMESIKTVTSVSDYLDAVRCIATVKAIEGFHGSALKDLESLLPLLRYAEPFVYYDILNSVAVELSEAGRKDEASNVIRHVIASPLSLAYPEWRETAQDLRDAIRSFVTVGTLPDRPRNVLSMPAVGRDQGEPPAWAGQPAPVVNYQQWKKRMAKKKKRNGKRKEDMDTRDMLFRIMEIYTNDQTTEAQRVKIWEAAEKIIANEPDTPEPADDEGPDDHKPGA